MLRVIAPVPPLSPAEQYALDILVDLSRVLPAGDKVAEGVPVRIVGDAGTMSLADARAIRWGIEPKDGGVTIDRRILTLTQEIAGAVAEQRSDESDQYGRVPPWVNALVKSGDERDPVVNRIAIALRYACIAAAERKPFALLSPWPNGKRWAMAMTHDLDIVALWPAYSALRVGQLLAHWDIRRAAHVAFSAVASLGSNPVRREVQHILAIAKAHGLHSSWFVITGNPTLGTIRAGDITYDPESPEAKWIIGEVAREEHEIGLHGSFATYTDSNLFERQRHRLSAIANKEVRCARQHFLRMRPGETQFAMQEARFAADSTFGFSERNGFRLGVADVIPVWHERTGKRLQVLEAPFVWMDRALSKYRHVENPRVGTDDAIAIAGACRQVEGLWTGIWHPNMSDALGFPEAPKAYEDLVERLMSDDPWTSTVGGVCGWRSARSSVRGLGFSASGAVRPAPNSTMPQIAFEDADGKSIAADAG